MQCKADYTLTRTGPVFGEQACLSVTGYCGHSAGFASFTAILLRWFFIIAVAFDISYETFFLTHLLEAFNHLLNGFTGTRLDLDHKKSNLLSKKMDIND